jgi:hypothetical protein
MASVVLPVACALTDAELQQRRQEVLTQLQDAAIGIREIADGYVFRFSADPGRITELGNFIAFEHQCCPFMKFVLTVEPGDGQISLTITGPEGTKEFLSSLL